MNAEQRLEWAKDKLIRAMMENLRGSITFHFNEGVLVTCQKVSNEKVDVDEQIKSS